MLFKLSNLNSNLAVTLGYLNPALNNSAQMCRDFFLKGLVKSIKGAGGGGWAGAERRWVMRF